MLLFSRGAVGVYTLQRKSCLGGRAHAREETQGTGGHCLSLQAAELQPVKLGSSGAAAAAAADVLAVAPLRSNVDSA